MIHTVAIDASSASSGGAIRFLSQICPALSEVNGEITYYLLNRKDQRSQLPSLPDNFHWIRLPERTAWVPYRLLWLQTALPRILTEIGADVLLAASDVSTLRSPCPMLLMAHNITPFSPTRGEVWGRKQLVRMAVHRWLIRRSAQKAVRVVFVSQWSRREMAPQLGIPFDRTAIIYHGVEPGSSPLEFSSTSQPSPGFVLIVSEVLEHKNLRRALDAYCNLTQHTEKQLNLIIAGTVTSPTLRNTLEDALSKRGFLDRVTFTGFLSRAELADLYGRAELLMFPSLAETFGLPLIEAMASGLPVVTSRAAAMPEICGEAACYFDPLDVMSITQAMQNVLTDPALRQAMVKKGLKRSAEFSWDNTARSLLSLLETASGNK